MTPIIRAVGAGLIAVAALGACTNPGRPSVQADTVALPTPIRSPGAAAAATIGQLGAALGPMGGRLVPPVGAYRPSEPQSLLQAPRVVMRVGLADPEDGYIVIYDLADRALATERAGDLASYLGSGFGQTNYPADAQFSVGVVGSTVVFTWWSRSRSSDPEKAEAAFDAIASVGDRVEVRK